jgi:hypothetical protein
MKNVPYVAFRNDKVTICVGLYAGCTGTVEDKFYEWYNVRVDGIRLALTIDEFVINY